MNILVLPAQNGRQADISAGLVLSCNLYYLPCGAVGVHCLSELLVAYLLGEYVAYVGLHLPVLSKLLRNRQVHYITWHLVAVGHPCVILA